MTRKFHGRFSKKSSWNWWQLLLFRFFCFWCVVDWCICPILFTWFPLLKKRCEREKLKRQRIKQGKQTEGENKEENEDRKVEVMPHLTGNVKTRLYTN